MASVVAPRSEVPDRWAMASTRLVLPCPLRPMMAVVPGGNVDVGVGVAPEVGEPEAGGGGASRCLARRGENYWTRTGISRYRKSSVVGSRTTAGLSESMVARLTSSPPAASMPASR